MSRSISGAGFGDSLPACPVASGVSRSQRRSKAIVSISDHRDGSFAGRAEEGEGHDFCGDGVAFSFDGHFDVEGGANGRMVTADAGEGDHLFQSGRPGGGSSFADLMAAAINGNGDTRGHAGNLRRHADFFVKCFDFVPIDFETDEDAFGSPAFGFSGERVATNEIFFLQIHQFAEANFGRRVTLRIDERFFAGEVVHFDEDKSGFDASDVERDHSRGMDVEGLSFVHEFVPDFHGLLPRNPDFVAEIARVASAGNVHGNAADFSVRDAKIF